jgi:hypothetical protein
MVMKITSNAYKASITREQFLFHEMRTTAKLLTQGMSEQEAVAKIIEDNLFQYPTEKSVKRMAAYCIARLNAMGDTSLIDAIAKQPFDVSKQICLYSMMKYSRLVWDFMITVIGEKYRQKNLSFGKVDLNVFFMNLQEQDDSVAGWSETTIKKIKQVLVNILVENEYLDTNKATKLNSVWLSDLLKNAIKENGDTVALAAFNCFD